MKQYCRYCGYAMDYNGMGTDFLCEANAPCGNNAAGKFYVASKGKRVNKCKHFVFNSCDIFITKSDGSFAEYKSRKTKNKPINETDIHQVTFSCI